MNKYKEPVSCNSGARRCGHADAQHKTCCAGEYCGVKNCRCVDGTFYGKMNDPQSEKIMWKHLLDSVSPVNDDALARREAWEKSAPNDYTTTDYQVLAMIAEIRRLRKVNETLENQILELGEQD